MATNMATDEVTKSMRKMAQVAVITCELCNQNKKATWTCKDCDEAMCNQCKSIHLRSKATRDHNMVAIVAQTDKEESTKVIYCKVHKSEPLQMHCKDCDVGLCIDCITGISTHKSHDLFKVQEFIENIETEVKGFLSQSKAGIIPCLRFIQNLNNFEENYSKETSVCIESIKTRGENLKAEIDMITNELIQEVQTTQTNDLDLIQQKQVQVLKQKDELEQFTAVCEEKIKKRMTYADTEDIKGIRKRMADIQTVRSTTVHLEMMKAPYFTASQTDTRILKDQFGKIDISPDNGDIDQTMVTSFRPMWSFTRIAAVNENQAWVAYSNVFKTAYLLSKNGEVLRETSNGEFAVKDFTVSKDGCLMVIFLKIEAVFQETNEGLKTIIKTSPHIPEAICSTQNDCVLVSSKNYGGGKILRYSSSGSLRQTIQYGEDKKPLFIKPIYLEENTNRDICVIDNMDRLTVVNEIGHLRFKYYKPLDVKEKPTAFRDVACDWLGNILVSDQNNRNIHLLSMNGNFLKFILNEQNGLEGPWGLSFDNKGQLWLKDGGNVKIFKYHAK